MITNQEINSLINDDLTNMSDTDIERYTQAILTRHVGHPAGSTSHAISSTIYERLRMERERRDLALLKKESAINLSYTIKSFRLNIAVLVVSILALIVSIVAIFIR